MKSTLFIPLITVLLYQACNPTQEQRKTTTTEADSIIHHINQYIDKEITTEGRIVHVCGVAGKKMKLRTNNGEIIMVTPNDSIHRFKKSCNNKRVLVSGTVSEIRIPKSYVDSIEQEGTLLCHINHTPCQDSAWVQNKIESGAAPKIASRDIQKLREEMKKSGKDYISKVAICANKIRILEKEK